MDETHIGGKKYSSSKKQRRMISAPKFSSFMVLTEQKLASFQAWFIAPLLPQVREEEYG